jgi:hypothetical protein
MVTWNCILITFIVFIMVRYKASFKKLYIISGRILLYSLLYTLKKRLDYLDSLAFGMGKLSCFRAQIASRILPSCSIDLFLILLGELVVWWRVRTDVAKWVGDYVYFIVGRRVLGKERVGPFAQPSGRRLHVPRNPSSMRS